ncbi:MAG: hypothetical protein EOM36_09215 [Bacteroidia bacterium]|nr:hypothetical protein [Bacteroidia bacterium]
MNRLVKAILQQVPTPLFTTLEISHRRYALVKRATADGDIIHIKRGLYTLSPLYRKRNLNPLCVSQAIVTLSYISLETALSIHGWIPEAVTSITAVTSRPSTEFDTPVRHFAYNRVPQKPYLLGSRGFKTILTLFGSGLSG